MGHRARAWRKVGGLTLALAFLAWLIVFLGNRASLDATSTSPSPGSVNLGAVRAILHSLQANRPAAIVRFTPRPPDTDPMRQLEREYGLPESGLSINPTAITWMIAGRFSVQEDLHLRFPRWGYVEDRIREQIRFVSGDDIRQMERLRALSSADRSKEPTLLFAVLGEHSTAVREATFSGPLSSSDPGHIAQLYELLRTRPVNAITQQDAEGLLASPNPWIVWLGLIRLGDLETLEPSHFFRAMHCRTPEEIHTVWEELYGVDRTDVHFQRRLKHNLRDIHVFAAMPPAQQVRVFEAVIRYWNRPPDPSRPLVALHPFQESVRRYRAAVADDPERRELLPVLDALLKLKG